MSCFAHSLKKIPAVSWQGAGNLGVALVMVGWYNEGSLLIVLEITEAHAMMPTIKNRITFDFDNERRDSYEKLVQIICSSHWGSGIDIFGFMNEEHNLLFEFVRKGVIVIDECEYELQEPLSDSETAWRIKEMLGKRRNHLVLREMAVLFADEPFEISSHYRNTIYLPNLKAFARADGIKPEDISEMLSLGGCDKIILFPYFPLDEKSAYYELTLAVEKENFVEFLNRVEKRREDEMNEAIRQAIERSTGYL